MATKVKTDKDWDRLYSAYLRQHEKSSMNLKGNIEDTLTKVEYKSLYQNMVRSGITQNITRTIVQKEAVVSGKQARVRIEVAKNMIKSVEQKIDNGEYIPYYEYEMYRNLLKSNLTMKDFRTNPEISMILNQYILEYNKEREIQDRISYAEFIDSP